MATLADRTSIHPTKNVSPEQLAGDLIQPGHRLFGIVWINRERLGGTPCFYGTRVPLKNLFDYVESGHTIGQFLQDFDGVTQEQATAVLESARTGLLADLPKP
jgi:uncharacterized protein (DUF433 family)